MSNPSDDELPPGPSAPVDAPINAQRGSRRNSAVSAHASRSSSVGSVKDEWFDADDREWPDIIERILNNSNAGLIQALDPKLSDKEKLNARKLVKLSTGKAMVSKAIEQIKKDQKEKAKPQYYSDPKVDEKIGCLVTRQKREEKIPNFKFDEKTKNKHDELNNIIKRIDKIYEKKLNSESPNLDSFVRFLVQEQRRSDLSQDDVIELLRIKLEPIDFETFEQQVKANGFAEAFDEFCDTYVKQGKQNEKVIEFHQFRMNFSKIDESLIQLRTKAKMAYPTFKRAEIDEKVYDYLKVNLREPILSLMLEEAEHRESLRTQGIQCKLLRGRELNKFIEKAFRENPRKQNYNIRNVNVVKPKEYHDELRNLRSDMEKLGDAVSTKEYRDDLKQLRSDMEKLCEQISGATIRMVQKDDSGRDFSRNNNYSKRTSQIRSENIYSGGPNYKEAVLNLYKQFPLDPTKTVVFYIKNITQEQMPRFRNKFDERIITPGHNPGVTYVGTRYKPDSEEFKGILFRKYGTKTYLTYDALRYFNERCIACGLTSCFDPYGKHCPGKNYEATWSVCANCNRGFHKTAECNAFLEGKN